MNLWGWVKLSHRHEMSQMIEILFTKKSQNLYRKSEDGNLNEMQDSRDEDLPCRVIFILMVMLTWAMSWHKCWWKKCVLWCWIAVYMKCIKGSWFWKKLIVLVASMHDFVKEFTRWISEWKLKLIICLCTSRPDFKFKHCLPVHSSPVTGTVGSNGRVATPLCLINDMDSGEEKKNEKGLPLNLKLVRLPMQQYTLCQHHKNSCLVFTTKLKIITCFSVTDDLKLRKSLAHHC